MKQKKTGALNSPDSDPTTERHIQITNKSTTKKTKENQILQWLVRQSQLRRRVTRFDAEPEEDYCFQSTVSILQRKRALLIHRCYTRRSGRLGEISCCEYWLDRAGIKKSIGILVQLEKRDRGAPR